MSNLWYQISVRFCVAFSCFFIVFHSLIEAKKYRSVQNRLLGFWQYVIAILLEFFPFCSAFLFILGCATRCQSRGKCTSLPAWSSPCVLFAKSPEEKKQIGVLFTAYQKGVSWGPPAQGWENALGSLDWTQPRVVQKPMRFFQVKLSTSLFLLGEGMASGREAKAPWLTRFSLWVATCDKRRKRVCEASAFCRGLDSAAALLSRRTPSSSKATSTWYGRTPT